MTLLIIAAIILAVVIVAVIRRKAQAEAELARREIAAFDATVRRWEPVEDDECTCGACLAEGEEDELFVDGSVFTGEEPIVVESPDMGATDTTGDVAAVLLESVAETQPDASGFSTPEPTYTAPEPTYSAPDTSSSYSPPDTSSSSSSSYDSGSSSSYDSGSSSSSDSSSSSSGGDW